MNNCVIAFGFLGASLYSIISTKFLSHSTEFEDSLDPEQKKIYHRIMRERVKLAFYGLVLGLVVSVVYLYLTYQHVDVMKNVCLVGAVTLVTQYMFYMLAPKHDYMLKHLKPEQVEGWLKVHTSMKNRFHIGLILGVIGYLVLALDLFSGLSCGSKGLSRFSGSYEPKHVEMIVFTPVGSVGPRTSPSFPRFGFGNRSSEKWIPL